MHFVFSAAPTSANDVCARNTKCAVAGDKGVMEPIGNSHPCLTSNGDCYAYQSNGKCPPFAQTDCSKSSDDSKDDNKDDSKDTSDSESDSDNGKQGGSSSNTLMYVGIGVGVVLIFLVALLIFRLRQGKKADEEIDYEDPPQLPKSDPYAKDVSITKPMNPYAQDQNSVSNSAYSVPSNQSQTNSNSYFSHAPTVPASSVGYQYPLQNDSRINGRDSGNGEWESHSDFSTYTDAFTEAYTEASGASTRRPSADTAVSHSVEI